MLDEPDVYVHPEQQSRMMPILRGRYRQCVVSTHSPTILSGSSASETLRIHRSTTVSRTGLTEVEHQGLVDQTIASLRQSEHSLHDVGTDDEGEAADFDTRTVEIRIVVYNDARAVLRDAAGHIILDVKGQGHERGRTAQETLNVEQVSMEVMHPDEVEVFINDRQLSPDEIFDAAQPKGYINLSSHAD